MLIPTGASGSASAGFDTTLIGNSIWLDGSADGLTKPASEFDAEDGKEFTLGTWFQLTEFGVTGALFCAGNGSGVYTSLRHSNDDKIYFQTEAGSHILSTTAVFRDVAWYHVLVSVDTTQATNTNRVKIFINGVEAALTGTYPALNHAYDFNLASVHEVGDSYENGAFEGYLAQSFMIGTQSIQQSDFAITDFLNSQTFGSNGSQFIPKEHSEIKTLVDAGSDNSFLLDFSDSGGTDAANLGNDISSYNNDFTPTSMAAANQSSNTPSLTYAMWNPLQPTNSTLTLSEGNLRAAGSAGSDGGAISTIPLATSGTSEFQVKANNGDGRVGIIALDNASAVSIASDNCGGGSGINFDASYQYSENGGIRQMLSSGGSDVQSGIGNWSTNDIITVRYNADDNELNFLKNNSAVGSTVATVAGLTYYAVVSRYNNYDITAYFESAKFPHTIGSENLEINSANVEPQTIQGVDGFATTLATESNIVSSVATSRDGWGTAYVDILKNRSSIETWLYRFGDDSSNEFTTPVGSYPSYSSTYQSTSSLSGTDNWLGYSIRIGADYLTAAGSASHSNGSATTVTHNLGTSRYCVLLFERGTTKDVWFHHPDFASGSLLKFVKDEALASSTQITTIGANSFQIGSGAATATYSYLVFADGGIASMGKYVGNGAVNGPYISMPHSSGFFARRSGGARSFWNNNSKSPGYNENGNYARFNDPQAEGTGSLKIDQLSGAVKIRDAYADQNTNAETFYWFSFGELSGGGESLPPVYGR